MFLLSILPTYSLINFSVVDSMRQLHSLPRVLINMSKCKKLFMHSNVGLGTVQNCQLLDSALSGKKLCVKGGQGGQPVPLSPVSPLTELWPLSHRCSWGYKYIGYAHSCSPDFPLHHSHCCRANISVCPGVLSSQQARIVQLQCKFGCAASFQ